MHVPYSSARSTRSSVRAGGSPYEALDCSFSVTPTRQPVAHHQLSVPGAFFVRPQMSVFHLVLIFVPFLGTQSFSYLNVVYGSNPGPDAGPDAGPIPVLIIIPAAFLVSTPLSGPLSGPGPRQGPEPRKIPQLHPYPSTPPHPHANAYARLHPRSARDLIPTSVLTPMPGWTLLLPVVLLPSLNLPLFLFLALSLPLVLFLPPFLMPILPLPPILPLLLPLSPTLTLPLSPPLPLAVLLLLALP